MTRLYSAYTVAYQNIPNSPYTTRALSMGHSVGAINYDHVCYEVDILLQLTGVSDHSFHGSVAC